MATLGMTYKVGYHLNRMRSSTFTSSFRARRYAARGIPYIEQVLILNPRGSEYHFIKMAEERDGKIF